MKQFLFTIALLVGLSINAQKKWTLQECVTHALENNITVIQGQNTILSNEQDIIAAKGNFLPTLSAGINHSLNIGNQQLFAGQFIDRTANNTNVGLNLNQTIFNGFRNLNLKKQAQFTLESSELELARIKDDISLNVVNAYLNVLFNKENLETAKAQYAFSQKQLDQVKVIVEAGVQPKANIYDAEATLANDEQNLTVAENNYDLALLSLSQLLQVQFQGFDVEIIQLDDPSNTLLYNDVTPILNFALENRNEIKAAEKNIENAKVGTELSKSGFYPTVTAGYGFGSNAFYSNINQINPMTLEEIKEDPFLTQLDNQKAHNFTISVNVPIFSGFRNKTNVSKSKIQEEAAQLNLEQQKLNLESTIQRAFTDAKAAFRTYGASKKSLEAQELAFNNSQERYNIGNMNAFDLEQARIRLINAQASLINAKYDFIFKTKVLDFYIGKPISID